MANEKHFVLDRLDAAIESASRIQGGISSRGSNLLDAVQQLRDNVDLVGAVCRPRETRFPGHLVPILIM
jgi:hypothetical protein